MPNITTVNDLQGKTEGIAIAAAADGYVGNNADITSTPPTASTANVTYKVNNLVVGNNGTGAASVTIAFETPNTGGTAFETFPFVTNITIPAGSTLEVLSAPIYLNDRERLKISAAGQALDVIASYENLTTTS